jgi:hypothetical protein
VTDPDTRPKHTAIVHTSIVAPIKAARRITGTTMRAPHGVRTKESPHPKDTGTKDQASHEAPVCTSSVPPPRTLACQSSSLRAP